MKSWQLIRSQQVPLFVVSKVQWVFLLRGMFVAITSRKTCQMTESPPRDVAIGIIFLSQTMIGILGDFSLLCQYLFFYHTECRIRAMDLIHKHLTIANFLVILSKGVPQTIAAFRLKRVFSDFARKLLLYVRRVGRGMSISTVCLLSVFQAITISPTNSCWKDP